MTKIYLGADHAGFELKEKIKIWLSTQSLAVDDCGNYILNPNDDYPDFAEKVALRVVKNKGKGILVCGSAEGMCIAANKIKGIRAVNPHGPVQVKRARLDEDANIFCLAGGGTLQPIPGMSLAKAKKLITLFLETPFLGQARHMRRLAKIRKLEGKYG